MNTERQGAKVSMFSRVLAWIFLACAALVLVGTVVCMFMSRPLPLGSLGTVMTILGLLIIGPLFLFAALKGRSPRWMTSMENILDDEARRRGIPASATRGTRSLIPVVGSLVFGLILFLLGMQLDLFEGGTGWFAMTVFGVAWLIVAAMMWRSYRRRNLEP